ncbi:MAG: serine/threonine-protein phosphatase, partial [Leptospira sp.]|nr:serine/threonine-protein phosphatase [Leptospira sp.]
INKNYISAIYAIFDLREMEIRYSVAGHPPLICLNHLTGNVTFLQGRGALLGWREVIHPVVNTKAIHEGDRYLFYTDGLTETMNEKDEIFGEEKVFSVLKANSQMNSLELTKKILSEIISFSRTDKFNDDVTYFIVDVSSNL